MGKPQRRRPPRHGGRANSDAERRALAKANAPAVATPASRPGFATLHTDGGARGNPGPAAIGYVLRDPGGITCAEHSEAIGTAGPNVAEYRALLAGLTRAHAAGFARVDARCDSRLVVAHLTGERSTKNPALAALARETLDVAARIGTVVYTWIPGDANAEAHALVARELTFG